MGGMGPALPDMREAVSQATVPVLPSHPACSRILARGPIRSTGLSLTEGEKRSNICPGPASLFVDLPARNLSCPLDLRRLDLP